MQLSPTLRKHLERMCETSGQHYPRDAVVALARSVIEESGQNHAPIDVAALCSVRQIEPYEQYLPGCGARLIPMHQGYIAEVEKRDSWKRRRFSLCHEIGHTLFASVPWDLIDEEYSCNPLEVGEGTSQFEEVLCNLAAAELLMPSDLLRDSLSWHAPSFSQLRQVADLFGVSLEAATRRVLYLGLWRCCMFCFTGDDAAVPNGKLKLNWCQPSQTLAQHPLATAALIYEVNKILLAGPSGMSLLRDLSTTATRVKLDVPGIGKTIMLEGQCTASSGSEGFHVLAFLDSAIHTRIGDTDGPCIHVPAQ